MRLENLLEQAVALGASELHLKVGQLPMVRLKGELQPLGATLVPGQLLASHRPGGRSQVLQFGDGPRLRAQFFPHQLSLKILPEHIPSRTQLGLPPVLEEIARPQKTGLVIVSGGMGSGVTTTLGWMLDHINQNFRGHLLTLEDPIEVNHFHKLSIVSQRQRGSDYHNTGDALRQAYRQGADVVMVGELRTPKNMRQALELAGRGLLVLAGMQASSSEDVVRQLVSAYPIQRRTAGRIDLSHVLEAVLCQRRVHGAVAMEILRFTPAVRNLVIEDKLHLIQQVLESGARQGMQTMEQALAALEERRH